MKKIIQTSFFLFISAFAFGQSVTISPQNTSSQGNTIGDNLKVFSNDNLIGLIGYRYDGTNTSKTAVKSNHILLGLSGSGYDTPTNIAYDQAKIKLVATQNWTMSAHGAKISFFTTQNEQASPFERMVINHDGNVGIGATAPTSKLHLHEPTSGLIQAMQITTDGTGNLATDGLGFTIFSSSDLLVPRAARIMNNENGQLILGANSLNVMRITPTGNVGINSAFAPTARFQVYHDTENDPTKPHINLVTAVDANNGMIKMTNLLSSRYFGQYYNVNSATAANNFVSFDYNGTTPILDMQGNGNVKVSGFTTLGNDPAAPKIKMKKFTGNTSSTDGGDIEILHGLGNSKIVSINLMVNYSGTAYVKENYTVSGYECNTFIGLGLVNFLQEVIHLTNKSGNSSNILNKPYKLIVTYEE